MERTPHALYLSSLMAESPSVRNSTSRHASRLINSFEMSSLSLIPSHHINQSLFLNPLAEEQQTSLRPTAIDFDESEEDVSGSSPTLFQQFFETNQRFDQNDDNVFDILHEFEFLCSDHLSVTADLIRQRVRPAFETQAMTRLETLLRLERDTWRLVRALCEDRVTENSALEEDLVVKMSDQEVIARAFKWNRQLREMQIAIDWLERNQRDDDEEVAADRVQFYSEGPYAWENTLHALKTKTKNYAKERQLCQHVDPDGPIRTKRPLHDLDVEDENRLFRYIFQLVRAGQLHAGKEVARRLGYHWLAAALDGWLLHHNPNYADDSSALKEVAPIEGNANRDLWKYCCWRAAKQDGTNIHERATLGALSGNVAAVLPLCTRWADKLWAYFRCSLDVHVEHELRQTLIVKPEAKARFRVDLPDAYWDNKLTAAEIFREIESRASASALTEECFHQMVQKFVILADYHSLVDYVYECARLVSTAKKEEKERAHQHEMESHTLRFFAHLMLVLRTLKLSASRESLCDAVLELYIERLIEGRQLELVAFYTSKLAKGRQITTFAKLLEGVEDESDRKLCLVLAKNAELDITSIATTVVDSMRTKAEDMSDPELMASDLVSSTTPDDRKKINSLDWLLFSEVEQWSEALRQANSLMRSFLLMRKVDAARLTFAKLPDHVIDSLYKQHRRATNQSELNADDDNAVREFLCHKAYIEANDAFSDWLHCLHNSRPKEPPKPQSDRFMDQVAYEHAHNQFQLELDHWHQMLKKQGKLAADRVLAVLQFPDGGWMTDQREDGSRDQQRRQQMDGIRREYLPQLVFTLHSIHKSSKNASECMKVADIVANERLAIYKTFSRELLSDLLKRLRETAIEFNYYLFN